MFEKNECVKPGDLVSVYPKGEYTGFIVYAALYDHMEMRHVPRGGLLIDDVADNTEEAIFHHVITSNGIMVLPDTVYIIEKINSLKKCE
tara:strand:+ start:1198 stop:1464 length:267 start_codon:yes stop_codon:yes gene_type:complete